MANQTELLNVSDGMRLNEKGQIIEGQEHDEELCFSSSDTTEELYSSSAPDTCGSRVLSTSGEFVEALRFRHFARYMSFTPTGKQGKKKQIMNGIEVSVVLHLV